MDRGGIRLGDGTAVAHPGFAFANSIAWWKVALAPIGECTRAEGGSLHARRSKATQTTPAAQCAPRSQQRLCWAAYECGRRNRLRPTQHILGKHSSWDAP